MCVDVAGSVCVWCVGMCPTCVFVLFALCVGYSVIISIPTSNTYYSMSPVSNILLIFACVAWRAHGTCGHILNLPVGMASITCLFHVLSGHVAWHAAHENHARTYTYNVSLFAEMEDSCLCSSAPIFVNSLCFWRDSGGDVTTFFLFSSQACFFFSMSSHSFLPSGTLPTTLSQTCPPCPFSLPMAWQYVCLLTLQNILWHLY